MKLIIPLAGNPVPHQQGIKMKTSRWGKPISYKNERLASFQQEFTMLLRSELTKVRFKRIEGEYSICCTFYFKDRKHGDMTNCWKTIEDACEGQLYADDWNAAQIHLYKEYDKQNPRVELSIE